MSHHGSELGGCPGPPHRQLRLSKSSSTCIEGYHHHQPQSAASKPVLSARDLTGAPLISLVPCKNRKLRPGPAPRKYFERQRHSSDQANIPSSYYAGQNLYQKLMVDRGYPYLQDFYQNPTFANRTNLRQEQSGGDSYQHYPLTRREKLGSSKSSENLSDTISVTSEEEDNFKPRIIRPRRRRKKEKRRGVGGGLSLLEQDESSCLGSETQWLPTGLLSAESESPDTRSDSATSDTEEEPEEGHGQASKKSKSAKRRTHRKLGGTLSVPTYPSFQLSREYHSERTSIGSDYYSLTSSSSCSPNSPQSSSSDQLCDSDNGVSGPAVSQHHTLTASKSYNNNNNNNNSNSYFRSPKLAQKVESDKKPGVKSRQLALRKTQSWAHTTTNPLGEFSLFSPGKSLDLLSGIRKHLSRLDLNEEETGPGQQ